MKQQNFVTTAMQPVQRQQAYTVQTKRTFNLFGSIAELYTKYTEWTARRNRVKICRTVAKAFRTDMESAGTLLFLFRDKALWIEGDPIAERERLFAFLAGEIEQPEQIEQQDDVHEGWPKAVLDARAPMIEPYPEDFEPEPHNVTRTTHVLSLQQLGRQKATQPKQPARDADLELAIDALIDYTLAAFNEGLIDDEGVLLKGNVAPWAKRGELPPGPKAKANDIINSTNPKVWSLNTSKLWQLNRRTYANAQSAVIALREAYVGNVGDVIVGEDEEG